MHTIVQVEGLRKTYGATVAVDDVSFEVREGEIFGMIGPNGAGKTTTIECLEGLRKSHTGAPLDDMVLLYPMLILSGAAWLRELMPATVEQFSAFLPLTYVVNLLRGLWAGETWGQHTTDVIVLAGALVAGVLISIRTFRWE